ncbi:hypothetical protein EDB81DRAFT_494329 [Dactylonectria macrodidyma]|uniref:Gastric mucin-like protein n=1 Tax=Dactylonectria macrodidyma TaxID=307937 RepID=A0A9P9EXK5_9HYPO|nr:hypothetical protein EDB81DRAFT_494329 [Dactylonectria macrodidyma]
MATEKEYLGSIVAFEGHAETISTQLRLLPTSPQILILPGIQSYVSNDDLEECFDARIYVKKTHDALVARNQVARGFLQASTPNSKRLVFMNGGTPGAQAMCIKAIMEHDTHGDYNLAKAIFNHLVKEGISGLDNPARSWRKRNTFEYVGDHDFNDDCEDPITRAMRAADALDRQTASLQPTNDMDMTGVFRPRSNSLPLYGYADNFGDAAPFFVFGAKSQQDDNESLTDEAMDEAWAKQNSQRSSRASRSSMFAITHYEKPSDEVFPGFTNLLPPSPQLSYPRSPSCIGEAYASLVAQAPLGPEVFTPGSDMFGIRSTDNVVYGEASLLDMRLSGRRATLTRVKSLDRIWPAAPRYRDLCIPSDTTELPREHESELEQETPAYSRRHSCMVITSTKDARPSRLSYIEGPRTIVVRSNRPIVKMAPVPFGKKRFPARSSYVDRGTDAQHMPEHEDQFKSVLPFMEDLVVVFKDEIPDRLLESVLRGYKTGHYHIVSHSSTPSEADETRTPTPCTPKSQILKDGDYMGGLFQEQGMEGFARNNDTEEYDPFAYVQHTWPQAKSSEKPPALKLQVPPTPAQTPPPSISGTDDRIHEFNITSQQTAVTIQNSLRSILKIHFPPETQGYRQFQFPLLPELEGLWRPIFRQAEANSTQENNRRMDQIFAIGAQRGVKKSYASTIGGQLERLGTKSSGLSRSGRLDFRYLLANAMQAFTAQPLTSQTHDNPFANPYLLATLIIPHLETYLALHSDVRFLLLDYPPEHLPTMLALQKLVGVDLMKVAQIVDSNSKDLPFTNLRGTGSINSPDQGCTGRYGASLSPAGPTYDVTVSKANFLLTSTATEAEVATFISTVLNILSGISPFYLPEESPKKVTPKKDKNRPTPLQGTFSAFPRIPSGGFSPALSPGLTPRMGSPPILSRAASIAETVKTSRSTRSRNDRSKSRRKPSTVDCESVLTIDLDDSDWDQEDRRIMPALIKRPEVRKGNSRKALKFLGLA